MARARFPSSTNVRAFGLPKKAQPFTLAPMQPATASMRTAQPVAAAAPQQPAVAPQQSPIIPAPAAAAPDPMRQYLGRDFRSLGLAPREVQGFADGGVVDDPLKPTTPTFAVEAPKPAAPAAPVAAPAPTPSTAPIIAPNNPGLKAAASGLPAQTATKATTIPAATPTPAATGPAPAPTTPDPITTPAPINAADYPGVPPHVLNNITRDQSGQMWHADQPVKWDGTQFRFDPQPMIPSAGKWGPYSVPQGDKHTGPRNGINFFRGIPFAAESQNQGGGNNGYGVGFGNWLRLHIPILLAQLPAGDSERQILEKALAEAGGPLGPGGTGMAPGGPPAGNPISRGDPTKPPPPPPGTPPGAPQPFEVPGVTIDPGTGLPVGEGGPRVDELDAQKATEAWVLPDGKVVGWGGKLDADVAGAFKGELGADATEAQRAFWRNRAATEGLDGKRLRELFNASREGRAYNLERDPLDEAGFATRAFRTVLGREPQQDELNTYAWLLAQGADRRAILAALRKMPGARAVTDADLDKLIAQGDAFDPGAAADDATIAKIVTKFKSVMGRDPSPQEVARYAALARAGRLNLDSNYEAALRHRRTSGFNRGGRVATKGLKKRRAPVTIDGYADGGRVPGYADGGEVSEEEWQRRNAEIRRAEDAIAAARAGTPLDFDPRYHERFSDGSEASGDTVRLRAEYAQGGLADDDPLVQQYLQRFGQREFLDENGKPIVLDDGQPRFMVGHYDRYADLAQDPSRVLRLPDGRMVWDRQNVQSWEMDDRQRSEETSRRRGLQSYGRMVAMLAGPVAAAYAFPSAAAGMAGGMDSVMAAAPGEGFGTALGTGNVAATTGLGPQPGNSSSSAPPPAESAPPPPAEGAPPAPSGPGTQPPAPVTEAGASTSGVPVRDLSVTRSFSDRLLAWVRANPTQAARLGLTAASLLGGGGGGGGGSGTPARYTPGAGQNSGGYTLGAGGTMTNTRRPPGYNKGGRAATRGLNKDARQLRDGTIVGRDDKRFFAEAPLTMQGMDLNDPIIQQLMQSDEGRAVLEQIQRQKPSDMADIASGGNFADAIARSQGNTQEVMPLDARVLPSGETVGRDDPRFFEGAGDEKPASSGIGRGPIGRPPPGAPIGPNPIRRGEGPPTGPGFGGPSGPGPLTTGTGGAGPDIFAANPGLDAYANSTPGAPVTGSGGAAKPSNPAGDPITELLGLSREQIDRYRRFDPLERQVIDEAGSAGSAAMQEERAALAGEDVAGQFDRERGMVRRNMSRGGMNPYSAQATAAMQGMDVSEAGSKAAAMNEARRAERDSGFGKRVATLGLGDSALRTGLGALSGGISALADKDRTAASREALAAQLREQQAARAQRGSEFNRTFDFTRERDTRDFGESRRRYDEGFGENRRRYDQGWDRGVFTDDRDFDFNVWRTNQGYDRADDERDYNRRRNRWQDIGSGVRTGLDIYNSFSGFADGGRAATFGLPAYEEGDRVEAPGDGTQDTQIAALANKEGVVNAEGMEYLDKVAPGAFEKINKIGMQIRAMRNPRVAAAGLGARG